MSEFWNNWDWRGMLMLLMSVMASLACITVHELSHGYVACRLGDPTAKNAGRLTLNPLKHIDIIGLAMMIVAHVGWAKPVPVDMRYFKNPKKGMALTALAGPISNFLMALVILGSGSVLYWFGPDTTAVAYILLFLCYTAVLSVGLGLFNLIPIPPLDGSKIFYAVLPDKLYSSMLYYERYIRFLVLILAWLGVFSKPLDFCIGGTLRGLCALTRFPFVLLQYYFGF